MTEANEQGQPLGLASTAELSLVARLRQRCVWGESDTVAVRFPQAKPDPLCQEAAAELERLQAEVKRANDQLAALLPPPLTAAQTRMPIACTCFDATAERLCLKKHQGCVKIVALGAGA